MAVSAKYWRQYEHAHTICWLGKDLSWNRSNPYFWCICFIPTFFIAMDFIWVSFRTKVGRIIVFLSKLPLPLT